VTAAASQPAPAVNSPAAETEPAASPPPQTQVAWSVTSLALPSLNCSWAPNWTVSPADSTAGAAGVITSAATLRMVRGSEAAVQRS